MTQSCEAMKRMEREKYAIHLRKYCDKLKNLYADVEEFSGKALLIDFIKSFRPRTIRTWDRAFLIEWIELLIKRGVYVETGRHLSMTQSLLDLLYRKVHVKISRPIRFDPEEMEDEFCPIEDDENY